MSLRLFLRPESGKAEATSPRAGKAEGRTETTERQPKTISDMKKFTTLCTAAVLCMTTAFAESNSTDIVANPNRDNAAAPTAVTVTGNDPTGQFGTKHVVKGQVLDSLTREGEPSAVLQFFRKGGEKPIAFTTTDLDGNFNQVINGTGDYYALFSNVGRKNRSVYFTLNGQETIDLGTILIEDDIEVLKAGQVVAQRPLVKMDVDKMSYDVANDVDSKASTVLDMLRKVPMVTVDGQDNISVNGSSSFQVTVDGKPSQMFSSNPSQIFKMMPASSVKSIQVITNPGVKYDAEGVGGVLNIEMARLSDGSKASTDGSYGTVRLMGSNRGGGAGLFYSQQKGKFTMTFNGNGMYQVMNDCYNENDRNQITSSGTLGTTTRTDYDLKTPMLMANFNASYEIDTLNLVSASAGIMSLRTLNDQTGRTKMSGLGYDTEGDSKSHMANITASVDYQHTWANTPGRVYTLSYQFAGSPNRTKTTNLFMNPTSDLLNLTDRKTDNNTFSMDNTVQADFTTPIGRRSNISTGAKFLARHNSSDSDLLLWDGSGFTYNASGSMDYDFYNNIGAVYAEYSGTFGKFGTKAGLRYEHTWQRVEYAAGQGTDFKTNYGDLVPTASLQYNISESSNIGLSYNMRISRPGITYLNPYVDISDPTAKDYGNTNLDTEHAHNINLVYNHFSSKWMVSLTGRYTYNGKGISSYSFYDSDNILNTTYGNIVESQSTGLNAFINWNVGPKTRLYVNGEVSYNDFRSSQLDQSNAGWAYNAFIGAQQTLPGDFRLSANAITRGRSYNLQGWHDGINAATLGVTKSFLNDKLSVSLMGISGLTTDKCMKMKYFTEGKDFANTTSIGIPIRQLTLSVSFSFGKQKNISVKTTKRTITNDTVLNEKSTAEQISGGSGLTGM